MSKSWKHRMIRSVLFLVFGIPGLIIFLISSVLLFTDIDLYCEGPIFNPIFQIIGILIGVLLILVGVNKLKEWLYGLVWFAFPLSFAFWIFLMRTCNFFGGAVGMVCSLFLFVIAPPFIVLFLVRKSITKNDIKKHNNKQLSMCRSAHRKHVLD